MANLTIRNVTINPIELISVERFEGKREQTGDIVSNTMGAISGFLNATQHQSHKVVAGSSQSKDDVSIHVDPFRSLETDIRAPDGDREVLRLTFRSQDRRHEVDIPSEDKRSSVMRKLDESEHELTAVFIPAGATVAVYSSANLNSWMRELDNDWPLGSLSIPGTHNSPTCHKALPSVRCQAVGVAEQLQNGVRFLDIRVSADPEDPNLTLVHSAFPISLTGSKYFGDMLSEIYEFLEQNPSETVLMSVKREGTGKGNDGQMGEHLKYHHVDKTRDRWSTEPRVPRLGEVRGRIVLIRRFGLSEKMQSECWDGRGYGIDAAGWPDNCEDGHIGDGYIRVQDFYEVTETQNVEKKIDFSRGQLERAAEQNFPLRDQGAAHPAVFVNFLSASNFFNATCWPERIAAKVNPAIVEYLCIRHGEEGKGPNNLSVGSAGTGIVVTDWVGANGDWDLIRCIVGMNAKLQQQH